MWATPSSVTRSVTRHEGRQAESPAVVAAEPRCPAQPSVSREERVLPRSLQLTKVWLSAVVFVLVRGVLPPRGASGSESTAAQALQCDHLLEACGLARQLSRIDGLCEGARVDRGQGLGPALRWAPASAGIANTPSGAAPAVADGHMRMIMFRRSCTPSPRGLGPSACTPAKALVTRVRKRLKRLGTLKGGPAGLDPQHDCAGGPIRAMNFHQWWGRRH